MHERLTAAPALLATTLTCLVWVAPGASAADKSGVKPTVLSLPSGPGSIEGLGESFEPQLNSGTAAYAVPLKVPPGRAGFAPELALRYNSGSGNGPFGLGWKLALPEIQRRTDKGLPRYVDWPNGNGVDDDHDGRVDELDEFDSYVYSNGEVLVPTGGEVFRCEHEEEFIRFERSGGGWVATRRDGVRLELGLLPAGQIQGPDGEVFRWLLERMVDTSGNEITFSYTPLDVSHQLYLDAIRYNPSNSGGMAILFEYEPRPDPVLDFRPGFLLLTGWRCWRIGMFAGASLVRRYRLAYDDVDDLKPISLLRSVTHVGADDTSELPPATFTYTPFNPYAPEVATRYPTEAPDLSFYGGDVDLMDVDGDALPDVLDTQEGTLHNVYFNLGPDETGVPRWGPRQRLWGATGQRLHMDGVQLADMDGDARTDMLQVVGVSDAFFFRSVRTASEPPSWQWEYAGTISQGGGFTFGDPNVRMVDLDGDGLTDVLRTDGSFINAWLNVRHGTWSAPLRSLAPPEHPQFSSGDLHLADMNGDRLQDLVLIQDGRCTYYPSMGFGRFGDGITFSGAPYGVTTAAAVMPADANGDGLADLLVVRSEEVVVYLNLGSDPLDWTNARFAAPIPLGGARMDPDTSLRQADVNGNGSTDLLWNKPAGTTAPFAVLDLAPGEQPYQLASITNGIGRTTEISYRSAVEDCVRDRNADPPRTWAVPIPVPVVSKIRVWDGREGFPYRTEIAYHDGYFDGEEKQFRGFGAAERIDLGDDAQGAPTLVTAHRFDTGAEQDALKGKPLEVEYRSDAGVVYYREKTTWDVRTLASGPQEGDRYVDFAYRRAARREILEGGAGAPAPATGSCPAGGRTPPVLLEWEYDVDDWGNQTLLAEYGRVEDLDGSGTPGDSLVDRQAWDDERVTVTSYSAAYASGQAAWILDRVVEQEVRDETGAVFARTRNYYDDETFVGTNPGEVTRGRLTMTRRWHDPTDPAGFVASERRRYDQWGNAIGLFDPLWGSAPGHWREIAYDGDYHTFPTRETIHTGNPDAGGSAPTLAMSAAYDPRWGAMTSSTDFNGFVSTYGYDAFGRLTSIVKPGDSAALPTTQYGYVLAHEITPGGGTLINWVETRQRETSGQSGTADSRTFYDGLGRKVMTRAEGEDAGQVVVSDTVRFNARSTPREKYLPYFDARHPSLDFAEPEYNTGFTQHQYDALGRETAVYQPIAPGATSGVFARTTYGPLTRTVEDEEQTISSSPHFCAAMRYVTDGLLDRDGNGRLREVHEVVKLSDDGTPSTTPRTWVTSYRYDVLGNFLGYTDSQANQKHILYDGLARKTFMNDPDRSWMWYAYDAASNLVRTRDAKGQEIAYTYDGVNRLQAEYYCMPAESTGAALAENQRWKNPGAPPARPPDVAYHYDVPFGPVQTGYPDGPTPDAIATAILGGGPPDPTLDLNGDGAVDAADLPIAVNWAQTAAAIPRDWHTARNARGFLAWVRDLSGEEHTSYDQRGRVEWVVKRINLAEPGASATFKTTNRYDAMDRMTTLVYPDMSTAAYTYNPRGLLESIPGVVPRCDYNPAGQLARMDYACGTSTTYDFDHRLRLARLATRRERDGVMLQDLRYAYDAVSNITAITDARADAELRTIGAELGITDAEALKFRDSAAYSYDDLYRLTGAGSPTVWGSISYRYDRIGNMVRKDAALLDPLPDMDLGEMAYGGSPLGAGNPGAWNRDGRVPGGPAGPHAFTGSETGGDAGGPLWAGYDANGNMVALDGASLKWDLKDRLAKVTGDGRSPSRHEYAYDSRRVQKAGSRTLGAFSSQEFEVRSGSIVRFLLAGDVRVAQSDAKGPIPSTTIARRFFTYDHLSSTVQVLSPTGATIEESVFFPSGHFRKRCPGTDIGATSPYGFGGKELDEESGLHYFDKRYYACELSMFCSVDPFAAEPESVNWMKSPQSWNPYSYVAHRPMVSVDPSGQDMEVVDSTQGVVNEGEPVFVEDAGVPSFSSQRPQSPDYGSSTNCLPNAEAMAGRETTKAGQVHVTIPATAASGEEIMPSTTGTQEGVGRIESELREGRRVVVGVNRVGDPHQPNAANGDGATNHFVTVYRVERSMDGKVRVYFRDPGTAHASQSIGTMTMQENTIAGQAPYSANGGRSEYQITTVRQNQR